MPFVSRYTYGVTAGITKFVRHTANASSCVAHGKCPMTASPDGKQVVCRGPHVHGALFSLHTVKRLFVMCLTKKHTTNRRTHGKLALSDSASMPSAVCSTANLPYPLLFPWPVTWSKLAFGVAGRVIKLGQRDVLDHVFFKNILVKINLVP